MKGGCNPEKTPTLRQAEKYFHNDDSGEKIWFNLFPVQIITLGEEGLEETKEGQSMWELQPKEKISIT